MLFVALSGADSQCRNRKSIKVFDLNAQRLGLRVVKSAHSLGCKCFVSESANFDACPCSSLHFFGKAFRVCALDHGLLILRVAHAKDVVCALFGQIAQDVIPCNVGGAHLK